MNMSMIKRMLPIVLMAATVLSMAGCAERQSGFGSSELKPAEGVATREDDKHQPGFESSDLKPAEEITVREDVLLELSEEEGKPCLTVTNQGQETLMHGNSGAASLQINRDGTWYAVPMLPDWGYTLEGYTLGPGQSYSGTFYWDAYEELPDGDYRLVFDFVQDYPVRTYAVAEFSVENGSVAY